MVVNLPPRSPPVKRAELDWKMNGEGCKHPHPKSTTSENMWDRLNDKSAEWNDEADRIHSVKSVVDLTAQAENPDPVPIGACCKPLIKQIQRFLHRVRTTTSRLNAIYVEVNAQWPSRYRQI
ncbi:hypothetical protein N7G274_009806 [Stereocaulon virgatum]|uniref:Uncharacterized protein n=1 Tax=Stereocaulon virgatum TaxID=373712 RepID=A0ABR3ZWH6_9LECA